MKVALRIWRQRNPREAGGFVRHPLEDVRPEMTLLEVLDRLNEELAATGEPPVAFDSDCREGICGACGIVVDGRPHGPLPGTTTCLLPMRAFRDGATITLEPFCTGAFPLVRDLLVDRRALDRVIQGGGYISVRTGSAPEANTIPVRREDPERALDANLVVSPYPGTRDRDEALTDKGWFWAGAGVLAVGIGASIVLLTSGGEEQRPLTRGTGGVVITTLSLP